MDNRWVDFDIQEPIPYIMILFLLADGSVHLGHMEGYEKLRKNLFYSFVSKQNDYSYDSSTSPDKRVVAWFPIPFESTSKSKGD